MKKLIFFALLSSLALSCQNHDVLTKINLSTEEKEIVEKAYSKTYMYPANFKYENDLVGSLYYENTISTRTNEKSWIELNTDDQQQAKEWSERSSLKSAYYRDLVAERETEKYFEFMRAYSINPKDIILSRVHRSSYFIATLDKLNPASKIGTLKFKPIDKETVKIFIEYMWTSYLLGYPDKVLEIYIIDYPEKVRYNLKSVSVTYGDFGICDLIEVKDFDFFVDKQSGDVTFESKKIKEIVGTCR